jgi:anti-sigma factor RsiW
MTCERIQARLVARLDGELPREELVMVDDHLSDCLPCARAARAHRRLGLSAPQPRVDTREPGFWDAMDEALHKEATRGGWEKSPAPDGGSADLRLIALLR